MVENQNQVLRFFEEESCYCRNIIIRQRGSKHNPGANVYISKDHTLHARVDGVCISKERDNKSYVSIIPFEVEA
jgi:large subunit ribosomal protein L27